MVAGGALGWRRNRPTVIKVSTRVVTATTSATAAAAVTAIVRVVVDAATGTRGSGGERILVLVHQRLEEVELRLDGLRVGHVNRSQVCPIISVVLLDKVGKQLGHLGRYFCNNLIFDGRRRGGERRCNRGEPLVELGRPSLVFQDLCPDRIQRIVTR